MSMEPPPGMKQVPDSSRDFAAALLAGGRSRRMGRDKAWVEWQGQPLWRVQLARLRALAPRRLLLSCRTEQHLAGEVVDLVPDPPGDDGPLPALLRCLKAAGRPLLVMAVDMPHMPAALLDAMVDRALAHPGRGVVYEGPHGYEPLAAVYPLAVVPLLEAAVAGGCLRLQAMVHSAVAAGLLETIPMTRAEQAAFANFNSPGDLDDAVGQPQRLQSASDPVAPPARQTPPQESGQ